jgi:hypothetical protein
VPRGLAPFGKKGGQELQEADFVPLRNSASEGFKLIWEGGFKSAAGQV